ncbi:circularly permuted type 2 ATP-grasp protein [Janthinobacterium sp. Mn2066]|uniref:circularly permuted type 2 ATP-grasp protein n=1 Tax=Janthinobacterium sp. Mn2066 TaxID=3395264 RepID=UPI003BDE80F4
MANFFNEMTADEVGTDGKVREHYREFSHWLQQQSPDTIARKRAEADLLFRRVGITFAVYGDDAGTERLIPFDTIPRIIPATEWAQMQKGLVQRVQALNMFLHDIYHEQNIIKTGIIPAEQIYRNAQYRPEMQDIAVASDIYAHIAGVDIVRAGQGEFYVLEDNLRVPSGVSYMLEDRKMMMRLFPDLFARNKIAPVDHYPDMLLDNLRSVAPIGVNDPTVVVMTPGMYNSAYFEHAFLAQQMGVELVEGKDLFVNDNAVYMRTTRGPKRVDVIYRRVDDDFLDPLAFRADSSLGVPGLLSVYRAGRVTLANAIGTGVADDKSIYPYVPDMIKFYLSEEPILNNVPTYQCRKPADLSYVLANLPELVVKEVHGAGGYGMLVGPASSKAQIDDFRQRLLANPGGYIAQPTLALSACPTYVENGIAPRHIDLRPFVLSGKTISMVPGGLTRVALGEGSLVVNSSQGGGTKDTWILEKTMAFGGEQ